MSRQRNLRLLLEASWDYMRPKDEEESAQPGLIPGTSASNNAKSITLSAHSKRVSTEITGEFFTEQQHRIAHISHTHTPPPPLLPSTGPDTRVTEFSQLARN